MHQCAVNATECLSCKKINREGEVMKKILAIALATLMMLMVFAGCGGGGTSSQSSTGESSIVTSDWPSGYPFKEGAFKGKTLTIWVYPSPRKEDAEHIFKEFEEATGAKVEAPATYDGAMTTLVAAVTAGTGPDISAISPECLIPGVNQGILIPLSDVIDLNEEIYQNNLNKTMLDAFRLNGKEYAFNTKGTGGACSYLIYRKSAIEEAGLDDPYELWKAGEWNFENFREICGGLTYDSDEDGIIDKFALTGYIDRHWYACAGGDANIFRWNEDGSPRVAITDPDIVEVFELFDEVYKNWYNVDLGPAGTFFSGKAAMIGGIGTWNLPGIIEEFDGLDDFGYVPFPYSPSNTSKQVNAFAFASGYVFTSNLENENKELAEEWVKYYSFWQRADVDYDTKVEEYIETMYDGNREWYEFEQELATHSYYDNSGIFGATVESLLNGMFWDRVNSYAQRSQALAPALQAEANAVFFDQSVGE